MNLEDEAAFIEKLESYAEQNKNHTIEGPEAFDEVDFDAFDTEWSERFEMKQESIRAQWIREHLDEYLPLFL